MTMPISRESFSSADEETKLLLIYDMLKEQNELLVIHIADQKHTCGKQAEGCAARFAKLEKGKVLNAGLAAGGGVVGGFIAIVAKWAFWK